MSDCSQNKNPLQHTGTSQVQRLLPGLDKTRFPLPDEKDFADWIVFAAEFSGFLKYYNQENTESGDWKAFFTSDISAQLGLIAIQDIDRYRAGIRERLEFIRDDDNKSSLDAVKLKLNELYSAIFTLSKALDETYLKLPGETTLKSNILNLIKSKLAPALKTFITYLIAAGHPDHDYLNHSFLSPWKILNKWLADANDIITGDGLSEAWLHDTAALNWNDYISTFSTDGDDSIFNAPLNGITGFADDYLSIAHAANHNLFTAIFDIFLSTYTRIIREAEAELLRTMESFDAHPAHYALFLTFLRLFKFSQEHINTLTPRHLDFYYREVLRLQPKPSEANQVHVLGELVKQVDEYLLAAGTALRAGKDSLGNEVAYTLDTDVVFNKAQVAQLKAFYKAGSGDTIFDIDGTTVIQNNTGRIFASPVANSEDGLGAELSSTGKEWHPYVHKVFSEAILQSISMPKAQLGFALASHYLYLAEGERKVYIRLVTTPSAVLKQEMIECWLTTEKGWYQAVSPVVSSSGKQLSDSTSCTEISFTIPGSDPAIVNYDAAVHGGTFNVALPVMKVLLKNEDGSLYPYDSLMNATVSKVEIRVDVGFDSGHNQKGVKNLLLSNDFGPVDASKPFMPFGPQPTPGNRLVIGNREIFTKKNVQVRLNIEWKDLPPTWGEISYAILSDGAYPNISINSLEGGIWNEKTASEELFTSQGDGTNPKRQISIATAKLSGSITNHEEEYAAFGIGSSAGFVSLRLTQSFGHKEYIKDYTKYLIDKANKVTPEPTEPLEPYVPVILSMYAGYSAYSLADTTKSEDFDSREIRLFHIYPFGEGEQHAALLAGTDIALLPQFGHYSEGTEIPHLGEFYIGIQNLEAGQSVSLLFQVMEGSSDPALAKPEDHVHWSYLSNNQWIDFENDEYSDNTLDLVQSGIISFAVPKEATTDNSILPAGYFWIRAAVKKSAEAVCKLLTIDAQAAKATFSNNKNAEDFLNSPLPAGTISKLKTPDASVKKIIQPYSSFGGRPKESDDHFYIRVSERLRHKARAITIWDYERLVLEAFPEIYRVKCLNHTQIEDGIYNEVRPGYVSIITIPSQKNRDEANPLKPFTQQSTLTNIENYLRERTSCFVKLRASQPQFEEIRFEFSLKLKEVFKDFNYYAGLLKEEITQFLSPWAFGDSTSPDFGGVVYKSVMINFIEERYYVDFITDVFMYVKIDDLTQESGDLDEVRSSTARSILVSVPASKHVIHEIIETTETTAPCP